MSRHIVRVPVSPELVSDMVRYGKKQTFTDSIPDSATFTGAFYDHITHTFNLYYEDRSFKPVDEGTEIPVLMVMHRTEENTNV